MTVRARSDTLCYGLAPDVLVKTTGPMSADLWIRWEGDMAPDQLA